MLCIPDRDLVLHVSDRIEAFRFYRSVCLLMIISGLCTKIRMYKSSADKTNYNQSDSLCCLHFVTHYQTRKNI
jgi:hypothetical protein